VVNWKQNDNQRSNVKSLPNRNVQKSLPVIPVHAWIPRAGDKFLGTTFYDALHTHVHALTMSSYILCAFSFSKEATWLKHSRNTRERMILYQQQTNKQTTQP
jgi:hypothetical protein